jgi:hypothetical protein
MLVVKNIIRTILQYICYLFLPKISVRNDNYKVLGDRKYHYFVGYYDINPVDSKNENILCHRVDRKFTYDVEPEKGVVGLLSIHTNQFKVITTTKALNWQLGSRVQWLSNNRIVLNDISDNGLQYSKMIDGNTGNIIKSYKRSFWAISPDETIGASLNFSRISQKRPGYGYKGKSIDGNNEILTLFSLQDDSKVFSISLEALLLKLNFNLPSDSDPYFNHIAWSPCSTKFIVIFHIAETKTSPRKIYPVVIDYVKNHYHIISDNGYFSHHTWINQNDILAYVKLENNTCFALYGEDKKWSKLDDSMPMLDGHPTYSKLLNKVIVDSYPNKFSRMSLYLGSIDKNDTLKKLVSIINHPKYKGTIRCDLHPRVNKNMVICDTTMYGLRRILIIKI